MKESQIGLAHTKRAKTRKTRHAGNSPGSVLVLQSLLCCIRPCASDSSAHEHLAALWRCSAASTTLWTSGC